MKTLTATVPGFGSKRLIANWDLPFPEKKQAVKKKK